MADVRTYAQAKADYEELLAIKQQVATLTAATDFETSKPKVQNDTGNVSEIPTTSEDFGAFKTATLSRLNELLSTKTAAWNANYPCISLGE